MLQYGCILGGLGLYKHLVDFAGCGATVPLTGFGYNLSKGAIEIVHAIIKLKVASNIEI